MTRRQGRAAKRDKDPKDKRKGGALFTGLLIGLALGMALAAALVWYLNMTPVTVQTVESAPDHLPELEPPPLASSKPKAIPAKIEAVKSEPHGAAPPQPERPPSVQPPPVQTPPVQTPPVRSPAGKPVQTPDKASPAAKKPPPSGKPAPRIVPTVPPPPKPKVNYTFYGILPGDKPARPIEPAESKDTWWLQIAALSDAKRAEEIRAHLATLKLPAITQKIVSNGQPLYRIRVGPYKREDDAFGDLDVLTENDFNARLLKDPIKPE